MRAWVLMDQELFQADDRRIFQALRLGICPRHELRLGFVV
jgi:hypothetical protein